MKAMKTKLAIIIALAALGIICAASVAFAFKEPSSGTLGYTVYEKFSFYFTYAGGYVGGLALVAYGVYTAVMGQGGAAKAGMAIVGGGVLGAMTTVVQSGFGFLM